ncbi:MAG: hypothetical protein QGH15_21805 [Kiritimatiellia bacterium]|jgi:hypothetical protein|nr:hypothetical protein [Kiritimatiellia bacterium]
MAKRTNGTRKKSSRINDVSPEVAARLAELAGEMRQLVYGKDGVPQWGTKFTEIESNGMNVGLELARLFMEQSVDEQSGQVPDTALECNGEAAEKSDQTKAATLETPAGEVLWEQPKTLLAESGRAFFPSSAGAGDQH